LYLIHLEVLWQPTEFSPSSWHAHLYLLCSLPHNCFRDQKSKRSIAETETHLLVPPDSRIFRNARRRAGKRNAEARQLPFVALVLLLLTFVLALPLFLIAPRSVPRR